MGKARLAGALTLALALVTLGGCGSPAPGGLDANHGAGGSGGSGGSGGGASPRCGDGVVDAGEACDDGNLVEGDGCSTECEEVYADNFCASDQECDGDRGEICLRDPGTVFGSCTVTDRWCTTDVECAVIARARCGVNGCYCRESAAAGDGAGICWERVPTGGTCTTDQECGNSELFDRPAACVELECDFGPESLCMPRDLPGIACPRGLVPGTADDPRGDLSGSCVPPESCSVVRPCQTDADCKDPRNPLCDPATGICSSQCFFDFDTGKTIGCGTDKPACHALPAFYDPGLLAHCSTAPLFGFGRCGVGCGNDDDCAHRGNDVHGQPYVCRHLGVASACLPRGCITDRDCRDDSHGVYRGFCDVAAGSCVYDRCRTGLDPRFGCGFEEPYEDCAGGHACWSATEGAAAGTCEPLPD